MRRLPRREILITTLLLLHASANVYAESPDHARVGAQVYETLAEAGRVRVLIALASPTARSSSREELMRDVSRAQNAVLNSLSSDHFSLDRQFQAIPALAGEITAEGLQLLLTLPGVLRVDEDAGGSAGLLEAIPLTHVDDLHALGFTGQGVTVAILDSGVDTDHSDLGDDLVAEACFCAGQGTGGPCCPDGSETQFGPGAAEDDYGHGSNVAGIVTSSGIVGPPGVAPDAEIVAIKVLGSDGIFCCTSDIVAGLDWIIANRPEVDVVNMSLGTFALFPGECDTTASVPSYIRSLAAAIDTLRNRSLRLRKASGRGEIRGRSRQRFPIDPVVDLNAERDSLSASALENDLGRASTISHFRSGTGPRRRSIPSIFGSDGDPVEHIWVLLGR